MAGVGGDKGRKLRVRGAAPVTRAATSATSLSVSNSAAASRQVEAPRRTNTTTSKVALKRAAAVDENNRTSGSAPRQHAKKRAALANLTNCSNIPSTCNIIPPLKPPVKPKRRAVAIQSKEADVNKENLESIHGKKSETNIPLAAQNYENALVKREAGGVDIFKSEAPLLACVATQTSSSSHGVAEPCPLKDLKPKTRQGCCFDKHMEAQGWSSNNYTNIDDNIKDPQMCSSYASDIYFYLQMAELKRRPAQNFMEAVQLDINASMRGILVDWLVEVAEEYKLVPDTLYLTIAYIDRFLSGNVVNRQRLQLLGVTCMLIASKYEEICAPQVDEFCYITDNTYGRDEVLQMEKRVLNYLQFELTGPTTKTFLRRFIRAAQAGQKTSTLQLEYLGNYLAELTLVEYGFLQYLPSMIASSAVFLAKVTLSPTTRPWNSTLQHYSGYKPSELISCVKAIHDLQCNKKKCTLPAVREKYKQEKFKLVANLTPPAIIPLKYFEDVIDTVL